MENMIKFYGFLFKKNISFIFLKSCLYMVLVFIWKILMSSKESRKNSGWNVYLRIFIGWI